MEWPPLPPNVKATLERLAFALWFAGVCALLYLTLQAQLARAAEFPKHIGAGTLLFESGNGFDPAAPLQTDLRISVAGIVARVRVAQRFRNPGAKLVEAVYALPLPDDAAVDRLLMQVGERVIEGEIHEREQAERIYGDGARRRPTREPRAARHANLFTTAVANIAPGEIDRHHDRVPPNGALRRRRVQPALAADDHAALRHRRHAGAGARQACSPRRRPSQSLHAARSIPASKTPARGAVRNEASLRVILAPGLPLAAVGARGHDVSVLRQSADGTSLGSADDLAAGSGGAHISLHDHGGGGGFDTSSGAGASNSARSRNVAAADRYVIEPTTPSIPMDRDFVARVAPAESAARPPSRRSRRRRATLLTPVDDRAAVGGAR